MEVIITYFNMSVHLIVGFVCDMAWLWEKVKTQEKNTFSKKSWYIILLTCHMLIAHF